jgi:hypothetical protein
MQQDKVVGPARMEGLRTGGSAMAERRQMETNADAVLTLPKRRLARRFFYSVNLKRKKIWRRRRQERLLDNTSRFL